MLGTHEILFLILCVIVLFFGGKKIPELLSSVAKGIRSFKEGLNPPDEDVKSKSDSTHGD